MNWNILYKRNLLLLGLIASGIQITHAQQNIVLKNREIKVQSAKVSLEKYLNTTTAGSPVQLYLQFKKPPNKTVLAAQGILLQDYVGGNTFNALISKSKDLAPIINMLDYWAPVRPEDKISAYLQDQNTDALATVLLSLDPGSNLATIDHMLKRCKAIIPAIQDWSGQHMFIVQVPYNQLTQLATLPNILSIDPKFEDHSLNNGAIPVTNTSNAQSENGYGLSGAGITIGVGDDSQPTHIDYDDRVRNFNPQLLSFHGLHTTGTVAGAGIVNEAYKGFAPKANLVNNFYSQIITQAPRYEQDFNMKVTNNSYAAIVGNCNYAGTYDATSQYLDQQALNNPQLLNIFAAGNDGPLTCSAYPTSYATVAGSYQSAKNTLVVANTGKNSDILSGGSSRGPAKDGRLKPEITAIGVQIMSTVFNNDYGLSTGTSMAAPNVTGAAGLLQQRYKQLNGGQYPASDLLKAILMNSATDLGNPGPDYRYGFGRMDVGAALEIIDSGRYMAQTISHNAQQTFTVSVPPNLAQAKIMLYWNDVPASPLNAKALVNDLDLNVTTPLGATRFPLVLNPEMAHVTDNATEGADHLNNVEQVVLNNPTAGNYTVKVSGFNIPTGSQSYRIVYQFLSKETKINYPVKGSKIESGLAVYLHWYAAAATGDFTVEYSTNNGAAWNFIETVTSDKRYATWNVPAGINSGLCNIRVTQNGVPTLSETFSIMARPVATLAADQCPGNITINWTAIPGINKYYLYKKTGIEMLVTDSTAGTTYTFSGLNVDSTYWVSVGAGIDGAKGFRALALNRMPNSGNCTNITHHGDLAITKISNPKSARAFTSTAIGSTLTVEVRNMDNVTANNYNILYRINNGSWNTTAVSNPIPAGAASNVSIPGLNLSATGSYIIEAVVHNVAVTDPISLNDTQRIMVKNVANPPMNLATPFAEGFELMPSLQTTDAVFALTNAEHFDFDKSAPNGRMRTFVDGNITITGNQSISLDNQSNQRYDLNGSSNNTLTGTFNLSNYNISNNELRFDFDYILHGIPKFDTENKVMIRGNDLAPWISINPFDTNSIGAKVNYGSISINNLLAAHAQSFSSSTQIAIQQRDTSLISSIGYGNGLTIDNFKLYEVADDIALIKVNTLKRFNCGLSAAVPLSVDVANMVNQGINNISISYQVDQQAVVTETIAAIPAKDTITYNFTQAMNLSAPGQHLITVWVHYASDNYRLNDTLKNIEVHNQPVITSFPYLEGFETNDGYYYGQGVNNTWAYGTPNAIGINKAASGSKAWKTNLTGAYNSNEHSYLYSPCFDVSSLSKPMLSFSLFQEIEAPSGAEIFDKAYMEYSVDGGLIWQKLGAKGQGYNWYDNNADIWATTNNNFWKVASIPLPVVNSISFRWVLESDPGSEFGGIAIDDIHIFDLQKTIYDQDSFSSPIVSNVTANTAFGNATEISGYLDPLSQSFTNAAFQSYKHTNYISPDAQQFFLPRNFTFISPNQAATGKIQLQLFVTDSMMGVIRNATNCPSCSSHPKEVYRLGVTTYIDNNNAVLNNSLADDTNGVFQYIPSDSVLWVPYNNGYYAQFRTNQLGEYWFNDGGITRNNPLPLNTLTFDAVKNDARTARIHWSNTVDTDVLHYKVQRAGKDGQFQTVFTENSVAQNGHNYSYTDTPVLDAPYAFYRIRYTSLNGGAFYSIIKKVTWNELPVTFDIYPNPTHDGKVTFRWYNPQQAGFHWEVYNVIGQKIRSGWIDQTNFNSTQTISLKDMGNASGIYILKVITDNQTQEYKIVYDPK
ncbi:hypothetical protein DBR32_01755 [Taibaiella sp. KBW10]|uniref:S8 family peptidase n=1 Tax=Taibaiella sp. KBW10 TaxID=2153357 RepID=UPI000F59498D|nr:S8 family peptidase [Taibaiella sp. KBW10]RQO32356.1 hypothetical protein DBR32_01755 [Taibaiella sp. KBW10]